MTSVIKVKWRARFKVVLVDLEDFEKSKDVDDWCFDEYIYNKNNFKKNIKNIIWKIK